MRCEDFLNQFHARSDGEMPAADAAPLEAHLAQCAQCRAAVEGLPAIDAELRRAFRPRREAAARLADRVAAALRDPAGASNAIAPSVIASTTSARAIAPAPRLAWGQVLAAVAAGFLLAVAIFRPWRSSADAPPARTPSPPIARLSAASGPVEMRAAGQANFFGCPQDTPIGRDAIVRTGPTARCEISLEDGNAVRLDCNTEVTLHKAEAVEINRGRLWSSGTPDRRGPEIIFGGGTIVPAASSRLAVDCQEQAVRLVVVEGAANVRGGERSREVGAGEQVRIVRGNVEEPESCDPLLETPWVNSLLALGSAENPELADRVNRLLAQIGAAKLSLLYEDELRRLGDGGVPPLLAFLDSTRATPKIAQRATAARIVADVAESRWIADLIALLTDANAEVRFHAAHGLERLTGRDQGLEPNTWKNQSWASCESAHQKWLAWWAANRDRYPAARRDVAAPTDAPF